MRSPPSINSWAHVKPCSNLQNCQTALCEWWIVLQEEERERRMDYIPDESAINVENIEVSTVPPD